MLIAVVRGSRFDFLSIAIQAVPSAFEVRLNGGLPGTATRAHLPILRGAVGNVIVVPRAKRSCRLRRQATVSGWLVDGSFGDLLSLQLYRTPLKNSRTRKRAPEN